MRFFYFSLLCIVFFCCSDSKPLGKNGLAVAVDSLPTAFASYWYQGLAEVSTYALTQYRYNEQREGKAVFVFVTEDFSRRKQVKLDQPESAGNDKQTVLKLNDIRRFTTGIYDYSIMNSSFTPVDGSPSMKLTSSVQDWCGQVFTQMNRKGKKYECEQFSYFEKEGDQEIDLRADWTEESLFAAVRISPEKLPQGQIQIVPSLAFMRMVHIPVKVYSAQVKSETTNGKTIFSLTYTDLKREFEIEYEQSFPHHVLSWRETFNGKPFVSATRVATRRSAYWTENGNAFSGLRDSLAVPDYW